MENFSSPIQITLVIPAFHESNRLPRYLESLRDELTTDKSFKISILVVDDGSSADEQLEISKMVGCLSRDSCIILPPLLLSANRGKGGAIMEGWKQSTSAHWLAFVDADGAVSSTEVSRVFTILKTASLEDSLFASRVKMLGRAVNRGWRRHFTGRIFANLVGLLLEPNIYDSQCGFKVISATAWKEISPKISEHGFIFDVDLLVALRHQGYPVFEIPVDWTDIAGSKVSLLKDTCRMITGIFRIYKKKRYGRY